MATRISQRPQVDTEKVASFLRDPRNYPDVVSSVEVVETHISWVFLTDRFAYKLKKPVRFEFLDFSTLDRRQVACHDEVRLNQRLARSVYLDVVPITWHEQHLRFYGEGTPVEYLVRMRRLPEACALDQLIRTGQVTDSHVLQVAKLLTEFYRQLPPLPVRSQTYLRELEQHLTANRDELLQAKYRFLDATVVRRAHAGQLRALRLYPGMFCNRVCDGRIVDGHGDLRPEHIYLTNPPSVIDCIEFNDELRHLDVLDELSFLAMECELLGADEVGGQLLDYYCRACDDLPPAELLAFYMSYRSCVRAKVLALRASQSPKSRHARDRENAARYLDLADRYAQRIGSPLLLIVRGLSGSGKSTLATSLCDSLGIEPLHTDQVRRQLFGPSEAPADYGRDRYSPERRDAVYDELFRRAESSLQQRLSMVLDGTFLTTHLRARAASLARRYGAEPVLIHCECPPDLATARIAERQRSLSEIQAQDLVRQRADEEPDPPGLHVLHVDTSQSPVLALRQVLQQLPSRLS